MSREIAADYNSLKVFLESYRLLHIEDHDFVILSKQLQKKYFAFITFIGEINDLNTVNSNIIKDELLYLNECCSDLGSAFFTSIHGTYKPSKLILRSSIETFTKGYFADEFPDILTEKSMYVLFDKVKKSTILLTTDYMNHYNIIHDKYKLLCADTHTADERNMGKIDKLGVFPYFDKSEFMNISSIFTVLVKEYLFLLCIKHNVSFHKMDYRNKDIILNQLSKQHRAIINGNL